MRLAKSDPFDLCHVIGGFLIKSLGGFSARIYTVLTFSKTAGNKNHRKYGNFWSPGVGTEVATSMGA
jgi:hypothetical protein